MIAGVERECSKATIELAEAAGFRYRTVLVRPPNVLLEPVEPCGDSLLIPQVADRSPLPNLLYNIPR
jgi:hypothetical protein